MYEWNRMKTKQFVFLRNNDYAVREIKYRSNNSQQARTGMDPRMIGGFVGGF